MFQSCFKKILLFTETCFKPGVRRMLSSSGTCSRLLTLLCVCVCTCISLIHAWQVFYLSVWTLHFHAFPTLKQILLKTQGVCLSGSVPPPGSFHSLFTFHLLEPFLTVICSIFTLFASQSLLPLLFFSSPLTFLLQLVSIAMTYRNSFQRSAFFSSVFSSVVLWY